MSSTYSRSSFNKPPYWRREEDSPFESRSWDEFQRRSRRMTEETKELWKNMEDSRRVTSSSSMSMSSTEKRTSSPPKEVDPSPRATSGGKREPDSWRRSQSLHRNDHPSSSSTGGGRRRIRFGDEPSSLGGRGESIGGGMDLGQIRDEDDCFEVTIDVSAYAPSELKVSVGSNRILVIEGKHEDERLSKTFNRKFSLPYNCLLEKITPTLRKSKNQLVIWVPKSSEEILLDSKSIPLIIRD